MSPGRLAELLLAGPQISEKEYYALLKFQPRLKQSVAAVRYAFALMELGHKSNG
jgi:hypothetical protein